MIHGKWVVLTPCVNQDNGKWCGRGDFITELSEGEYGRLMAFGNIGDIPKIEEKIKKNERKKNRAKRQNPL